MKERIWHLPGTSQVGTQRRWHSNFTLIRHSMFRMESIPKDWSWYSTECPSLWVKLEFLSMVVVTRTKIRFRSSKFLLKLRSTRFPSCVVTTKQACPPGKLDRWCSNWVSHLYWIRFGEWLTHNKLSFSCLFSILFFQKMRRLSLLNWWPLQLLLSFRQIRFLAGCSMLHQTTYLYLCLTTSWM